MLGRIYHYKTKENRSLTKEEVKLCVSAIKKIIAQNENIVKIEFKNKDSFNDYNINFNGIGNGRHETFILYSRFKNNTSEEICSCLKEEDITPELKSCVIDFNGKLGGVSVITHKKPYSKIVEKVLLECQKITNNAFEIKKR